MSVKGKKNNNEVNKNQFIFFMKPISPNEIVKDKYVDLQLNTDKDDSSNLLHSCRCNSNLKLFKLSDSVITEINDKGIGIGPIYFELNGKNFEAVIQYNGIAGNPDEADTEAKKPNSGDGSERKEIRAEYVPLKEKYLKKAKQHSEKRPYSPVVAIMDSGIDLRYYATDEPNEIVPLLFYKNQCDLRSKDCMICDKELQNHVFGWSFIREEPYKTFPENPYDDDGFHKHGTRIAKIIAKKAKNNVRLMILKTADYRGKHDFFDIYCAFEYILAYNKQAKLEDKVKIINASWSWEEDKHPIFGKYLERLGSIGNVAEKIIFITSAGNQGRELGEGGGKLELYPAMYSNKDNLVYTITTVGKNEKGKLEVKENESKNIVDAGVLADESYERGEEWKANKRFYEPLFDEEDKTYSEMVEGSSYAAAYYTGFIASQIQDSEGIFKNDGDNVTFSEIEGNTIVDIKEKDRISNVGSVEVVGNKVIVS
jgi:Subtilase family